MVDRIEFSIPDFWNNYNLNLCLLDLMKNEPDKFHDDVIVSSCYGSFPCIWNGGRLVTGTTNIDNIKNTLQPFYDRGIEIRYTFTNRFITEDMCKDTLGNKILQLSNVKMTGVNCGNEVMLNYIRNTYPEMYTLCSTTMCLDNIEEINKLSKDNLVVPDYNINNKFDILESLSNRHHIELLVGEACIDNCLNRTRHHNMCANSQFYNETEDEDFSCPNGCEGKYSFYEYIPKRHHYISIEDIREKYLPLGFYQFKISGRNDPWPNVVERYIHWLVKAEFKNEIRNKLILSCYE